MHAAARGIALFLGTFSLLNLAGDLRFAGANANLWWIDFSPLPVALRIALLGAFGIAMLAFGLLGKGRFAAVQVALLVIVMIAALVNVIRYYTLLARGTITTSIPVPLSLFILIALTVVLLGLRQQQSRSWLIAAVALALLCLFPILQIIFFGVTDYRRPADVIVVFGARTYANGRLSSSLEDRVRTGIELYRAGYAPRILFSGGEGDGAIHETEAMRRYALAHGVPASAIVLDADGINTEATVRNTAKSGARILAVSHFYHLPRIKMTYQRYGAEAYTVPAHVTSFQPMAYNVARESIAFWAYYLRRLR
jgi:uncharacterized SAM-binding protein YcdF (DUF218 family)